ncbi:MAG: hypothetical protein KDK97_05160 [Verrucomicrobiales bacterium]|nr:hypothetical protein [Verrucomicrobiales bacterium]MCP5558580.1 hypothetical protein [Verrucomicrobiaceae bacterium]
MPTVTNYRLPTKQRQVRQRGKAVANVRNNVEAVKHRRVLGMKKWIGVLVLVPLALITFVTMLKFFGRISSRHGLWRSEEVIFFGAGTLAWTAAYLAGWRPIVSYVFGHELSHLIVAKLCGGKILDFHVSAKGGYVETDKSNTAISLAPYLIPLYSIVAMIIFGLLGIFVQLDTAHALHLGRLTLNAKPVWLLYLLMGFTWAFHLTFTITTIRAEQGDLKRNGEFFSTLLIFIINVVLVLGLVLIASPNPDFSVAEVFRCWFGVASSIVGWLFSFLT